ncbi:hypothetical protein [Actinopolymorpha pittospori]
MHTSEAAGGVVRVGWENSYGNGRLWVGALWPEGIVLADQRLRGT